MRRVNKLAAAVALALAAGMSPQVVFATLESDTFTPMHIDPNKEGDMLIFPVFVGQKGVENYYTVSNSSGDWIQGHIRFRGAGWSPENDDFDVILSPGDVFVFRIADVDGDGWWEIDQSLDPLNFDYTDTRANCYVEKGLPGDDVNPANKYMVDTSNFKQSCIDAQARTGADIMPGGGWQDRSNSSILIPKLSWQPVTGVGEAELRHNLTIGYIEFIGEGVLDGMSHAAMYDLLTKDNQPNQRKFSFRASRGIGFSNEPSTTPAPIPAAWPRTVLDKPAQSIRGTSLWEWANVNAPIRTSPLYVNHTLSDVRNVLSGTGFIAFSGQAHGVAFNAESVVNFRTASGANTKGADASKSYNTDIVAFYHNYPDSATGVLAGRDGSGVHGECDNGTCAGGATIQHRMDTYPDNGGVILHQDACWHSHQLYFGANTKRAPFEGLLGDIAQHYIYQYREDSLVPFGRLEEGIISYNNTCGPTMADGDDYNLSGLRGGNGELDDWDNTHLTNGLLPTNNSIGELEEALRQAITTPAVKHNGVAGQSFKSFYFDGKTLPGSSSNLQSWYFMLFPTKFIYGEQPAYWATTNWDEDRGSYLALTIKHMMGIAKPLNVEVWNIFEETTLAPSFGCKSPCRPAKVAPFTVNQELAIMNIGWLKDTAKAGRPAQDGQGRVVIQATGMNNNWPFRNSSSNQLSPNKESLPFLMYAFEAGADGYLSNWRSWQRSVSWDTNMNYGGDINTGGVELSE